MRTLQRAAVHIVVVACIGFGVCPVPARAQAVIGGDWRAGMDAFAQRVVDAGLTPGLAVAVATGDWVAYTGGFGVTDLRTRRPVDGHTPFYIASSTKSLTALAVVLAAHRGELDLDAPMTRYLPTARLPDGIDEAAITVRDLLTMTHGLSGDGPITILTAYTGQYRRESLPGLIRHHTPTGAPETFDYNNLGYNLLGLILEARHGESWKDVVRREVLEPVGMPNTSAYRSRMRRERIAYPHEGTPAGFGRMILAKDDANLHAAGGHFASARDLARYVAAHVSGGVVEGERVLPAKPVRATHALRVSQDREFGPYHRHGWGYGWDIGTYEGDTLVHRFGGFGGYRAHVSFMPGHDLGVIVLVNGEGSAGAAADLVANYAYDRLLGKPGLESRYAARLDSMVAEAAAYREGLAEHLEERRARSAPLPHPLDDYAGTYVSPILGRMEWRVVAGGLEMRLGVVRSRAEVFDASNNQLRIEIGGGGLVVRFDLPSDDGPARSVSVAGHVFERVAADRAEAGTGGSHGNRVQVEPAVRPGRVLPPPVRSRPAIRRLPPRP